MAVIDAHGAREIARIACDRATSSRGVEMEVNRLFVMTSDGRILTRVLDIPADPQCPFRLSRRYTPGTALNVHGLIAYVQSQGYQVKT